MTICFGSIIRTLTSHEDLQKCLNAIKDNAFHVSDYPVIITLEDHLPPKLQGQVAKVIWFCRTEYIFPNFLKRVIYKFN